MDCCPTCGREFRGTKKDRDPFSRFLKYTCFEPNTGCWYWFGDTQNGYGRITINYKDVAAHRFSYEKYKEKIPEGLVIDHLCREPLCVNPDHMEAVTSGENTRRGNAGRYNAIKTHCPHGHPYEGDNVLITKRGSRICRECCKVFGNGKRARQTG